MNGFLLDTDVVSILAPSRGDAPGHFLEWLERMDRQGVVFLSVATIHEVEKGIALLDQKGATARAAGLRFWLAGLVAGFADRILPLDTIAAAISGQLEARAIAAGHNPGMADAMVAGIARAHNLTVITRNTRHFLPFGIGAASPEEALALG